MQIVNDQETYTYEETCDILNISRSTLNRAIAQGVFRPIRKPGASRKYLLKNEVDAKIGQLLYSLKEPKEQAQADMLPSPLELLEKVDLSDEAINSMPEPQKNNLVRIGLIALGTAGIGASFFRLAR